MRVVETPARANGIADLKDFFGEGGRYVYLAVVGGLKLRRR
jgi:hypothetical protein